MSDTSESDLTLNRRNLLKAVAATAAGTSGLCEFAEAAFAAEPVEAFIEAYSGQLSYQAGDQVGLHVSTGASRFSVEVARIGAERTVVFTAGDVAGARHPTPPDASSRGCRWPVTLKISVADTWASGYYQVLLRANDGQGKTAEGEAFFVVCPSRPGHDTKILLQLCTNTYNAYNHWGGSSFYGGAKGAATRVSFDRPHIGFVPGEQFTSRYSGWRNWEQPFVQWAETAGYRLDFAVNSDLESRPELLESYRLVLSVGHDEYWSAGMRDCLEAFITRGGNVAFFSGNTAFWQVRSEDQGRALVGWKMNFEKDPMYASGEHRFLTGMWNNRLVQRPENQMTGVSFAYGGYHRFFEFTGDGCYAVHRPDHWLFAGTGLERGGRLGANDKIVGYECDGCQFTLQDGLPVPTHQDGTPENFEILASAPAWLSLKGDRSLVWASEQLYGKSEGEQRLVEQPGSAVLGCYTRGGTVVTAGCTEWARGLAGRDPAVEQVTRNVLDRLSQPA